MRHVREWAARASTTRAVQETMERAVGREQDISRSRNNTVRNVLIEIRLAVLRSIYNAIL